MYSEKMNTVSGIILKIISSVKSVFHKNQNNTQSGRRAPLIYSEHLVDDGDGILFFIDLKILPNVGLKKSLGKNLKSRIWKLL